MTHQRNRRRTVVACAAAAVLVLGACGDEDVTIESCIDEAVEMMNAVDYDDAGQVEQLETDNEELQERCSDKIDEATDEQIQEDLIGELDPDAREWFLDAIAGAGLQGEADPEGDAD